jgi:methylamine utilization protein MauE
LSLEARWHDRVVTDQALLVVPLACSVVLFVSGAAKLGDTDGTRAAFISMGVPTGLATPLAARALPYAEIALGLLLLTTWGWALLLAGAVVTLLFAMYWVLVARVLRSGEDVDCACFGSLGDGRVTGWTLARNSLLVGLGALALVHGAAGGGVLPDVADLDRAGWLWLAMTVLVGATAVLVVGRGGTEAGPDDEELLDYERSPIPFAMLENQAGERVTLRQLAHERAQLLVFLSVGCGACTVVAERIGEWAGQLGPVGIAPVFTSPLERLPAEFTSNAVPRWYDVEAGATQTLAGNGRPSAALLGADGQLAGGPVTGAAAITTFVDDILAELAQAGGELPTPPPREATSATGAGTPLHADPEHERDAGLTR